MATVAIEYGVSKDKVEQIKNLLETEEKFNVNFNGEVFQIERGDFTEIKTKSNDASYIKLLNKINNIISQ
jgi:hypothetical protein